MARYRKIDVRMWNDARFRSLSDNGKLAFILVLTHPSMTALGAMRATLAGLAEELGWTREAFQQAFGEALSKGMAEHDAKACLIALPRFIKYNQPESPNVVKAWVGALDLLPECALKNRVVARAKGFAEGMGEAFGKAFAKTMPIQEQEQEQEQEKTNPPVVPLAGDNPSKPQTKGRQIPDDFQPDKTGTDLANSLGIDIAAEFAKFLDHHKAKGSTMKDWQAAWRNWARNAATFAKRDAGRQVGVVEAAEPAWRTEQRERMQAFAPSVAARCPVRQFPQTIDVEASDVTPDAAIARKVG